MKFTTLQAQGNTAVIGPAIEPILQEVCRISRQDKKLALKSCLRDCKTAVLVWKCLHDSAPRHLVDLCVSAASTDGRRQSRSAVSAVLLVPWTRTSTGQRSFAVCCSRTCKRLPTALRSPEQSLASFKRQLKTHLSVPHTHRGLRPWTQLFQH